MTAVAVVEDNADLLEDLLYSLRLQGFQTSGFADGRALDEALASGAGFDVLVLDLGLPGEDGLSIARRLRASHERLGIVMLTARGALEDRITGLLTGADVYLTKPFDLRELGAAVSAVARRLRQVAGAAAAPSSPAWQLDTVRLQVRTPEGRDIALTWAETRLLRRLAEDPGVVVSRETLIRAIDKDPENYDSHTLEVLISRLRAKLGDDAPFRSVRGRGYVSTAAFELCSL